MLNRDYFTIPQEEIPNTYPVVTVVGGKIEVVREEAAEELGLEAVGPQLEFRNTNRYANPVE